MKKFKYSQDQLKTADEYKKILSLPGRKFYVYVLTNLKGIPFYVGKGVRPNQGTSNWYYRALAHEKEARQGKASAVAKHIRKMWRAGDSVRYVHHYDSNVENYVLFEEQITVAAYLRVSEGGTLVNATGGGQGMYGHTASPATRIKMSKTRTGRALSPEHRLAISEGRKKSEKVRLASLSRSLSCRVPVYADGNFYLSKADAAAALGVCTSTIVNRINRPTPGYRFA